MDETKSNWIVALAGWITLFVGSAAAAVVAQYLVLGARVRLVEVGVQVDDWM